MGRSRSATVIRRRLDLMYQRANGGNGTEGVIRTSLNVLRGFAIVDPSFLDTEEKPLLGGPPGSTHMLTRDAEAEAVSVELQSDVIPGSWLIVPARDPPTHWFRRREHPSTHSSGKARRPIAAADMRLANRDRAAKGPSEITWAAAPHRPFVRNQIRPAAAQVLSTRALSAHCGDSPPEAVVSRRSNDLCTGQRVSCSSHQGMFSQENVQ